LVIVIDIFVINYQLQGPERERERESMLCQQIQHLLRGVVLVKSELLPKI